MFVACRYLILLRTRTELISRMVMVDHFLNEMLKMYSLFLNQCFFVNRKTELFLLETLFFLSALGASLLRLCGRLSGIRKERKKTKHPGYSFCS